MDWRSREFNKAADHVANCVIADGADVDTLRNVNSSELLEKAVALQIFSDGGFANGIGATAFVLVCVRDTGDGLQTEPI